MTEEFENSDPDLTYPLSIDYLPDEILAKAEGELNETPENKDRLLRELKIRAESDNETKDINFLDDFLRQFLRQSKYNVSKSFKRLQSFIKFRKQNENIFKNVENITKSIDYQFCTPLPFRCREGCTITLFDYSKWSPSGITVEDLNRIGIIMYHQALRNPLAQVNGFKMIVDWKGSNFTQLRHTPPKSLYLAYKSFVACTPARNKEIHFVNEGAIWQATWTLLKPFMSEKMKKRIIVHSSPEDLLNYFPKHCLPVQYGGDLEDYYMEEWMKEANVQHGTSTLAGQPNTFDN
ncbi:hypothetical protein JTE90_028145 [Oedothorax gibbosus]|uniref:CRAL-TRIO domain-containing protein n=1 Tax=Oedothorax gibbosus TaxID=931172 RepID=A0AAV6VAB7_9ARAC|nr:hypothetical protein JTE90_028145 [Oedothorax gibbosus]